MAETIHEFFITFGVKYTADPRFGEKGPHGMHKDGYCVIEAPTETIARKIAHAIFDREWSMIYEEDNFDRSYHPDGELLRIEWNVKTTGSVMCSLCQEVRKSEFSTLEAAEWAIHFAFSHPEAEKPITQHLVIHKEEVES